MRQVTSALANLLDGWTPLSDIKMMDLYTFTLVGGEVFRFAEWQQPVTAPYPNTNSPLFTFARGPRFKRTVLREQVGVRVDECDIEVYAGANDLLGTLTWANSLQVGLFDGATCQIDKGFISRSSTTQPYTMVGTMNRFYGPVGETVAGRTWSTIHVKSQLDKLGVQCPKRLIQPSCSWTFGKPGCGYDRVNGKNSDGVSTGIGQVLVTALPGSDQTTVFTGFTPGTPTSYDDGTITGVTGLNAGFSRTLRQLTGGQVIQFFPWFYPVLVGDQFFLLPGCDHTYPTCSGTFNNADSYGGEPYVPPPETAI